MSTLVLLVPEVGKLCIGKSNVSIGAQGCDWEFTKRAEIVQKTQKMASKHKKRHILGISKNKQKTEISFIAELSHPWVPEVESYALERLSGKAMHWKD